nr:uncharacterized protein LOC129154848 isoform X2 [Nothobranchius furzeri]
MSCLPSDPMAMASGGRLVRRYFPGAPVVRMLRVSTTFRYIRSPFTRSERRLHLQTGSPELPWSRVGAPGEQLLRILSSAHRGFKERCDNSPVPDNYSHWVLSSSACYQLVNLHSHLLQQGTSRSPVHPPHHFSLWPSALLRSPARSWNRCSAPSLLQQLPLRPDTPSSQHSTPLLESNAARTALLRCLPSLVKLNK